MRGQRICSYFQLLLVDEGWSQRKSRNNLDNDINSSLTANGWQARGGVRLQLWPHFGCKTIEYHSHLDLIHFILVPIGVIKAKFSS